VGGVDWIDLVQDRDCDWLLKTWSNSGHFSGVLFSIPDLKE
jgi:hypothetical protein